uniref:Putative carboxypeptidase n subunit 2 n=1 Tax=Lutzomyia longipalpis TaxID=7200 RepID=A0A1B0GKP3_LUTLO
MIVLRSIILLLLAVEILGQDIWCDKYRTDSDTGFQYSTINENGDTELKNSSYCYLDLYHKSYSSRTNHTADGEKISYMYFKRVPKEYISQQLLDKLPKLQKLGIENSDIKHIGKLSHENIKIIVISSCSMNSINRYTFQNFPALTEIQFYYPNYTIEDDAFAALKNLRKIELYDYNLKDIKENVFRGLNLTELDLNYNTFEEFNLSLFSTVYGLKKLLLNNCKLKKLHTSVDFLSTNFSLDLKGNQLESLNLTTIEVRSLNVSQNKLENLIIGKNCQDLRAHDNKIKNISLKNSFSTLKDLNLTNNLLGNNLEEICQCVNLERLWLDGNKISDIGSCFSKMTKLEKLSLKGNEISEIHKNSFHPNNNLKFLVLSDNQLEFFFESLMPVFPKLQYIKLNNNKIYALCFNPRIVMPNLMKIDIFNNKITDLQLQHVWKKLKDQIVVQDKENSNSNVNDTISVEDLKTEEFLKIENTQPEENGKINSLVNDVNLINNTLVKYINSQAEFNAKLQTKINAIESYISPKQNTTLLESLFDFLNNLVQSNKQITLENDIKATTYY